MRVFFRTIPAFPCAFLLASACGGDSASDLAGAWISTDTISRVEFFPDGRATVGDPLNTLTATWRQGSQGAAIEISDTTGAPLQIDVVRTGDQLVLHIEADTVRYQRANPALEAAFARIANNEAIQAMTADLMGLKDAQSTVAQLTKSYSKAMPMDFQPSNSVAITITDATTSAWSAVASHPATKTKCSIAVGGGGNGMVDCR